MDNLCYSLFCDKVFNLIKPALTLHYSLCYKPWYIEVPISIFNWWSKTQLTLSFFVHAGHQWTWQKLANSDIVPVSNASDLFYSILFPLCARCLSYCKTIFSKTTFQYFGIKKKVYDSCYCFFCWWLNNLIVFPFSFYLMEQWHREHNVSSASDFFCSVLIKVSAKRNVLSLSSTIYILTLSRHRTIVAIRFFLPFICLMINIITNTITNASELFLMLCVCCFSWCKIKFAAKLNVLSPCTPIYIFTRSRPHTSWLLFLFLLIVILKQPVPFFSLHVDDQWIAVRVPRK